MTQKRSDVYEKILQNSLLVLKKAVLQNFDVGPGVSLP